jgi:hypothetical protein
MDWLTKAENLRMFSVIGTIVTVSAVGYGCYVRVTDQVNLIEARRIELAGSTDARLTRLETSRDAIMADAAQREQSLAGELGSLTAEVRGMREDMQRMWQMIDRKHAALEGLP